MLFGCKKYGGFLREERGIELRGFEMGVVLGFCIILGGRKRKNVGWVCGGQRQRSLLALAPLVGGSFKTS